MNKKILFEIYGLLRMIFGVAQLTALSAGYFLAEFILRYPSRGDFVFNEDVLLLTYIAVFIRALFHIVVGIGIAKIRNWVRIWLFWGWPLILIINYGLFYSIGKEWILSGHINSLTEGLSLIKLILYLTFVSFEIFFVAKGVYALDFDAASLEEEGGRIETKKVAVVFFSALVFFALLLFLGKPIKQGFHKGFYKTKGKPSAVRSRALEFEAQKGVPGEGSARGKPAKPKEITFKVKETLVAEVEESATGKEIAAPRIEPQTVKNINDIPYKDLCGFIAAFLLILGFIFQLLEINQRKEAGSVSLSGFILFAIAFLLLAVYSVAAKVIPVSFMAVCCFVLSISVILSKNRYP
ncbi:MAG: hypothetical protein HQL27_09560 [Candidatus Omnitrophica bacterium]|nr:hypothetical protein [Candidatus Omnitrophota bacterium]